MKDITQIIKLSLNVVFYELFDTMLIKPFQIVTSANTNKEEVEEIFVSQKTHILFSLNISKTRHEIFSLSFSKSIYTFLYVFCASHIKKRSTWYMFIFSLLRIL